MAEGLSMFPVMMLMPEDFSFSAEAEVSERVRP